MKLQCDVCERAPAAVICCADEAALCTKCDVEIHGANKLASKHQRLLLQCLSSKLPPCDICREKAAFIFCVEDRALFCKDCDEPIHSSGSLSANHQRFLATGIKVALSSSCSKGSELNGWQPPGQNAPSVPMKPLPQQTPELVSAWGVDDLLQLSDTDSSEKKDQLQFGELEWLADAGLFSQQIAEEALSAAEVPEIPISTTASYSSPHRTTRIFVPQKKPRVELPDDAEEHFTVPDLG